MDIGRMHSIARNGLRGARVDFDLTPANGFEYRPGVVRRLVECSIAVDCAHAKQLDSRVVGAEKKSECILGHNHE